MTKFRVAESKTSKRNNRKEAVVLKMIGAQDENENNPEIVKIFKMLNQELAKTKKISFDPLKLFSE